jgi:hypothetical protein
VTDAAQPLLDLISGFFPAWLPWLYALWVPVFAIPDMLTTRRFALLDLAIAGDATKHECNRILKGMMRRWGVERAVMYYYPVEVFLLLFIPLAMAWVFAIVTAPLFPVLPIFPLVDFYEGLVQVVIMVMMAVMVLNNYHLGNKLKRQDASATTST